MRALLTYSIQVGAEAEGHIDQGASHAKEIAAYKSAAKT